MLLNRAQLLWHTCMSRQQGRRPQAVRPHASSSGAMPPPSAGGVPGRSSSSSSGAAPGSSQQMPAELAATSDDGEERRESFVTRIMKPLQDFGFGRSSFWEGGVGLFVLFGVGTP